MQSHNPRIHPLFWRGWGKGGLNFGPFKFSIRSLIQLEVTPCLTGLVRRHALFDDRKR